MNCTTCQQTTAVVTGYNPASCTTCASGTCFTDASCVVYTGPNLPCSSINTNDALDVSLQKIDGLLCAATSNYSSYNTYCLAPITTQQQFVETISNYVCTLNTNFNTFVNTTFVNYQNSVTSVINSLNNPGITCAAAGVTTADNLPTILLKYCSAISAIAAGTISLSGVNWSSCYTVSPVPTTVAQGFNVLINQICLLKAQVSAGAVLPVFNNQGTCLTGGTAADSLVTTINLIKTKLCQTGTLNVTSLSWGCTTQPSNNPTDLQGALQSILNQITTITQSTPFQYSSDFSVTPVDGSNACAGQKIALTNSPSTDRFVASTAADTSPGTLQQKLAPGTNVTLDYTTTPGVAIINASGGSSDGKVFADAADSTSDYLINKVEGGPPSSGIAIVPTLNTDNPYHIVQFGTTVDLGLLFTALLQYAQTNPAVAQLLCSVVSSCPSPCSAPTNVTVVYTAGGSSTTTTTTTT